MEQTPREQQPVKQKSKFSPTLNVILMGILTLVLAIAAGYFYLEYKKIKENPQIVTKQETEALVEQANKLIDLPKDETPQVATVLDKEKLKDQPFFANAQNGDKILIYTKAKKAVIIRPKENRLINVGPIAIDQKALVSVALVNAGGDVAQAEKSINDALNASVSISGKSNAKTKNVKQMIVVDVSGQNAEAAEQIASAVGGGVGALPSGESAPDGAAIVVFVK